MTVVVGVKRSSDSRAAIRLAAQEASRRAPLLRAGQTLLSLSSPFMRHPVRAGQMRATRQARAAEMRATDRAPGPSLARHRSYRKSTSSRCACGVLEGRNGDELRYGSQSVVPCTRLPTFEESAMTAADRRHA